MATFPTNIPIDVGSDSPVDLGVTSVRMDDGRIHNQTHYPSSHEVSDYNVSNQHLTLAEQTTVIDFLRANADLEFDLTDPLFGVTYSGRLVEGRIGREVVGGGRVTLTWQFNGRRVL